MAIHTGLALLNVHVQPKPQRQQILHSSAGLTFITSPLPSEFAVRWADHLNPEQAEDSLHRQGGEALALRR